MDHSPQTPAPPKDEAELINWVRLIRSRRVGPSTFLRLLSEHRTAEKALNALPEVAHKAGVKTYTVFSKADAQRELETGRSVGAKPVCLGSRDYPKLLGCISDPPPLIWVWGRLELLNKPTIALVGARNASSLGTRMSRLLSRELADEGFVIASGLARGIDTAAHLAALETGTVAVMAGGLDQIYPKENTTLAQDIAKKGALLSEQPPGLTPQARHFPRRNRIISGLSIGTVVLEGAARSGSLITAQAALEQGREIMAIPGHPLDGRAVGCNNLIRDGATLVRSGKDVAMVVNSTLSEIQRQPDREPEAELPLTTPDTGISQRILDLLGPTPIPEDQLIRELSLPSQSISPHLLTLELEGKLNRHSGGMLALAV